MKYRLVDLIQSPQNLTLQRWANPKRSLRKTEFLKLEPGYWYDKYADDELFLASLKNWTVKVRWTQSLEDALKERGIQYQKKKGCSCSGGKMNLLFKGIEVAE